MMEANKYDVVVIGFGKAGKTLANDLAKAGKKVAVIEKSNQMYGGTCINVGCLPTKSLVHSAKIASHILETESEQSYEKKNELFKKAMANKEKLTAMLREKNYAKLANFETVTIFDGLASFVDGNTVKITSLNEEIFVAGDRFIINTGAKAFIPDIPGVHESKHVHISDGILELENLPKRLAIIGAGYIGLEFAGYFTQFGTQVTIYQNDDSFLPREDAEDAEAIRLVLEKAGVVFAFEANAKKIADTADGVALTIEQKGEWRTEKFDEILIATGRVPNTDNLDADKANVTLGARGEVAVDEKLRTSAPNIWAVGDVKGGPQFTYISLDDYRIVLPQLLEEPSSYTMASRRTVPNSVFIDPPFSRTGMNEKEATAAGIPYRVVKMPAAAVPKAQVLRETEGFLKALINTEDQTIVGATLFCYESHEMINLLTLAINAKIPYTELRDQIYTHPIMSEALNDLLSL